MYDILNSLLRNDKVTKNVSIQSGKMRLNVGSSRGS